MLARLTGLICACLGRIVPGRYAHCAVAMLCLLAFVPASVTSIAPARAASPDAGVSAPVATSPASSAAPAKAADMTMSDFLDRLMVAESGGRNDARNPRSTAVGPYQFIERTWLDLARRIFPTETQALTPTQILALRTDRDFARRGAEAYTRDNAAILKSHSLEPTFPHLRLAFLLGPFGAVRVLEAPPQTRVTFLLGPAVATANPFMYGLTVEALVARAARDLAVHPATLAGVTAGELAAHGAAPASKPRGPSVVVRCNLDLPACRRWQALAIARLPAAKPSRKLASALKTR